jgi:hypothetical protein
MAPFAIPIRFLWLRNWLDIKMVMLSLHIL